MPIKFLWARRFSEFEGIVSRAHKINALSFSSHGCLRGQSWMSSTRHALSSSSGDGEKLFDPRASGRQGQECPQEIRTKIFLRLRCFFLSSLPKGCISFTKQSHL